MTDLADLKKACAALAAPADSEKISAGPTVWYAGKPAAAPPGTVALATGNGPTILIREQDVRQAKAQDGGYLVEVPVGTSILLRHDQLVKAGSGGTGDVGSVCAGCGPKGSGGTPAPGQIQRIRTQYSDIIIGDITVCDYYEICFPVPFVGTVCVWVVLNCKTYPGDLRAST